MPAAKKTERTAIVLQRHGELEIMDVPMPPVPPIYILVRTTAVAMHPIDVASTYYYGESGTIGGCEFAGVVLEVGSGVVQDLKPGDRVAGFVHGNKNDSMDVVSRLFKGQAAQDSETPLAQEMGAYSDYIIAHGDLCFKIPPDMSDEDAATYGASMTVAGQALYMYMKLPRPREPSKRKIPVLINGAACASGAMAVQLARLSNLSVIATCSPKNFDWVKSLGADHVYDYHDPDATRKIRRDHPHISYGYDCPAEPGGWKFLQECFSLSGGSATTNMGTASMTEPPSHEGISWIQLASYTAFGTQFTIGPKICPDLPEHYTWAVDWWREAEQLIYDGKLKPLRTIVREGGLEGVMASITGDLRERKHDGYKLVYRM